MSRPVFGQQRDPIAAKAWNKAETEAAKDARFIRELKASLRGVTVACPGCGETLAPQDLIPHEEECVQAEGIRIGKLLDAKPSSNKAET